MIGRRAAQRLAEQELAKGVYHPHQSFWSWLLSSVERLLTWLFTTGNNVVPGGWWALVAVAALVVVLAAVVLTRFGPVRRSRRRRAGPLAGGTALSARDRRARAADYAAAGDLRNAMIEALRAIASDLEERGVLVPDPGRTADEFAAQAGRLMPGHARALAGAARSFDDVCYGGQSGSRAGYERLRDLDAALQATSPTSTPSSVVPA
jgi:type II secretory pathway pseudopilin PulG